MCVCVDISCSGLGIMADWLTAFGSATKPQDVSEEEVHLIKAKPLNFQKNPIAVQSNCPL